MSAVLTKLPTVFFVCKQSSASSRSMSDHDVSRQYSFVLHC